MLNKVKRFWQCHRNRTERLTSSFLSQVSLFLLNFELLKYKSLTFVAQEFYSSTLMLIENAESFYFLLFYFKASQFYDASPNTPPFCSQLVWHWVAAKRNMMTSKKFTASEKTLLSSLSIEALEVLHMLCSNVSDVSQHFSCFNKSKNQS